VSSSRGAFHRAYRSTDPPSRGFVAQSCAKERHNVEDSARIGANPGWRGPQPPCTMVRETSQNAHDKQVEIPVPHVDEEIASQPACWGLAVDLASRSADRLPAAGERVAVIGCGTSWF